MPTKFNVYTGEPEGGTVPAAAVGPTMSDIATAATTPRTQDERKECS